MNYSTRLLTPALSEPVTLEMAKLQCRVDNDAEDDLICQLITAARERAEEMTGRQFIAATWEFRYGRFPTNGQLLLPRSPLLEVTKLEYTDANGDPQEFTEGTNFVVDTHIEPPRLVKIYGGAWPGVRPGPGAVLVTARCGYGDDAADVPAGIKQAILLWVGELYSMRENMATGTFGEIPTSARALLQPYTVGDEFHNYSTEAA